MPILPIPIGRINSSPTLSPNVQHNQTPPDVQINNCTQPGFCADKPLNPYSHTAVRSAPWKLCLVSNCTEWKRGNLKVTYSHRLFDCFFFCSVIIILWETACDTISPQSTFSGAGQTTEMFEDTATRRSHCWTTVNRSKEPWRLVSGWCDIVRLIN